MAEIKTNLFLTAALREIPRLLGQLNRNPLSESYGSFDRAYWHYRVNDISCARHQEAALTLALLYAHDFYGNVYYGNNKILAWINASLEFTLSIQNNDGSFNEWYLNEKSFVCTSFVAVALAETLMVLGKDRVKDCDKIISRLAKAADWLIGHSEVLVFNQLAGSVLALAKIAVLTGNSAYQSASREKLAIIEKAQSSEGWWSEYGGPDLGYLSLMIDYLAKYHQLVGEEKVLNMVKKANAFLTNFLHPNLTAGGEYMSRNTEYVIPSGFAYLAALDKNAEIVTAFCLASLKAGAGVGPGQLDDRYLCYILYNWLQAGIYLDSRQLIDIAGYLSDRRLDVFFKDSGLRIFQNSNYYFTANLYKGGSFRLYSAGSQYFDSGAEIKFKGNKLIAGALDYNNKIETKPGYLKTSGWLKPAKEPLLKTPLMVAFKFWQLLFGRLDSVQLLLKSFLRKKMITLHNPAGLAFEREFIFSEREIRVGDKIGAKVRRQNFYCAGKNSFNFIPSSKYFTVQEIKNQIKPAEQIFSSGENESLLNRVFSLTAE